MHSVLRGRCLGGSGKRAAAQQRLDGRAAGRGSASRAAARSCPASRGRAAAPPGSRRGARRSTRRRPPAPAGGRAALRASPASGAPASTITSAPSSATQRSASATRRSPWSSCTLPMSASGSSRPRMLASRPSRPLACTVSRYQALDALRDRDDGEALAQQAGAGQRRFGEAGHRAGQHLAQAARPGSPKAATTRASKRAWCSAGELRRGVGADQRLEARLDVGHAEGRGEHLDLGARRRAAPRPRPRSAPRRCRRCWG